MTNHSEQVITEAVTRICRQHFASTELKLTFQEEILPDDWGRNFVWRYRLLADSENVPATVVVKISNLGGGHIFDEWAGLQFLNSFYELDDLIPTFYGGDKSLELVVLEDLGAIRSQSDLGTILEGQDAQIAREALIDHARQMAKLHLTTTGHEQAYNTIRAQFPANSHPVGKDQFEEHFAWFEDMLLRFGIGVPDGLNDELIAIRERLHNPGNLRAYTRGDVCPSNIAYHQGRTRFYDFEMGRFRNIFLSAVYFRLSHVSCMNGSAIPRDIQIETQATYFEEMVAIIPDPIVYRDDYAAAAIAMLIWILSMYLEKDDRPRHLVSTHQRIYSALRFYIQNPAFDGSYLQVSRVLNQLFGLIEKRWPKDICTLQIFSAFKDSQS